MDMAITILSPDPYLKSYDNFGKNIAAVAGMCGFPYLCSKTDGTPKGITGGKFNFAKKVLTTGECSLVILDEVLGLIDNGIITVEDLKNILESRDDDVNVILTGIQLDDDICPLADEIFRIDPVNYKVFYDA